MKSTLKKDKCIFPTVMRNNSKKLTIAQDTFAQIKIKTSTKSLGVPIVSDILKEDLKEHENVLLGNEAVKKIIYKALLCYRHPNERTYDRRKTMHVIRHKGQIKEDGRNTYKFKNIEDSVSDFEEDDYHDFVPKWYSVHPKSRFTNVISFIYKLLITLSLLFFPLELIKVNININNLVPFHIYLEMFFILNYAITLLTGFQTSYSKEIKYSVLSHFKYRYCNNSVLHSCIEIMHLAFTYTSIKLISLMFDISKAYFLKLHIAVIISRFLMILYIHDWINMNYLVEFSNSFAFNFAKDAADDSLSNKPIKSKKESINDSWNSMLLVISVAKIFVYYFLLLHCFACLWIFFYINSSNNNEISWETRFSPEISDSLSLYVTSFYFCLTTLLSVGYGDIIPTNIIERLFVVFMMTVFCFFYSFLVTLISFLFLKKEKKAILYEEKVQILKEIKKTYPIKDELYRKLSTSIENSSKVWKNDKLALIESLPTAIKLKVQKLMFNKTINNLSFFAGVHNESFVFEMCSQLKSQYYEKKIILLESGYPFEEVFFVISGCIIVLLEEKYENYPISKIQSKQSFGDHYVCCNKPSKYTLRTGEKFNEIQSISREAFKKVREKYPSEIEFCRQKSDFSIKLLDEMQLGAKIFYELHGTLKQYREFSMKLINLQINNELGNLASKKQIKKCSNNNVSFNQQSSKKLQFRIDSKSASKFNASKLLINEFQSDSKFKERIRKMRPLKELLKTKDILVNRKKSPPELDDKDFIEIADNLQFFGMTGTGISSKLSSTACNLVEDDFKISTIKRNYLEDRLQLMYYNYSNAEFVRNNIVNTKFTSSELMPTNIASFSFVNNHCIYNKVLTQNDNQQFFPQLLSYLDEKPLLDTPNLHLLRFSKSRNRSVKSNMPKEWQEYNQHTRSPQSDNNNNEVCTTKSILSINAAFEKTRSQGEQQIIGLTPFDFPSKKVCENWIPKSSLQIIKVNYSNQLLSSEDALYKVRSSKKIIKMKMQGKSTSREMKKLSNKLTSLKMPKENRDFLLGIKEKIKENLNRKPQKSIHRLLCEMRKLNLLDCKVSIS